MVRLLPLLLLLTALLAGAALRASTVFTKPIFYHDESHTYQAATGHVGEAARITYGRQPPYAQWVPAAEWKRLMRPERQFAFTLIGRDALAYDVHPPLYYWLLHLACLAFGTHPWTGTLLNATLDVATFFAIYAFARRATGDRMAAAAACFIWFTTAAALQVAVVEARMYSLLTLIAVLFADQLHRYVLGADRVLSARLIAMFALTTAGALTHHHFGLLAGGAMGLCMLGVWTARRRRTAGGWRRVAAALVAIAAGYGVLVLVHPVFFGTGYKHLSDARWPDAAGFATRTRQATEALAHFVVERRFGTSLPWSVLIPMAFVPPAILLLAGWRVWRRRARPAAPDVAATEAASAERAGEVAATPSDATAPPAAGYAVALGAGLLVVTLLLYMTGATPAHAMSYRYLAMAWPFIAVSAGILLARRPQRTAHDESRPRVFATVATCAAALAVGLAAARLQWRDLDAFPGADRAGPLVRAADRVILDNVGRGHWPRAMWRLRDDAQVVVALPNDLLRRTNPWRKDLQPGTVYISPARSSERTRLLIVESFGREFEIEFVGHLHSCGDVYYIGNRRPPAVKQRPATGVSSGSRAGTTSSRASGRPA